ncbi:MAG: A/G-specific adenine glycosylase [Candidatus Electryoneaceae bacterium]|nr:A/G-specific adenine glycosylase [Candidatus Electryoneaceae bacterium]
MNEPLKQQVLVQWFLRNRRDLPWRSNRSPYSVWISEVMLQQTVLKTVIPYFNRWMDDYPNILRLADADENNLLLMWEGLGYYRRAVNILKTARIIVEQFNERLPADYKELRGLPGIGDYTASAILSIGYGQPYPVVDANVRRVMRRLYDWEVLNEKELRQTLQRSIPHDAPGQFNEALMELGQLLCTPRNPVCKDCPLQESCIAYLCGTQNEIIKNKRKSAVIRKETILLLVVHKDQLLITKRRESLFEGLWLLPKLEKPDSVESAVRTFIIERIAPDFVPIATLTPRTHHYTRYAERLNPSAYRVMKPYILKDTDYLWIGKDEISHYPFPSVYRRIINDFMEN